MIRTKLRRFCTGLMLVATLVLVSHAGFSEADVAVPGSGHTRQQIVADDGATAPQAGAPADRADRVQDAAASRPVGPIDHDHGGVPCKWACCGPVCITALLPSPLVMAVRAAEVLVLVPSQDTLRDGVDPAGLKRPPSSLEAA